MAGFLLAFFAHAFSLTADAVASPLLGRAVRPARSSLAISLTSLLSSYSGLTRGPRPLSLNAHIIEWGSTRAARHAGCHANRYPLTPPKRHERNGEQCCICQSRLSTTVRASLRHGGSRIAVASGPSINSGDALRMGRGQVFLIIPRAARHAGCHANRDPLTPPKRHE